MRSFIKVFALLLGLTVSLTLLCGCQFAPNSSGNLLVTETSSNPGESEVEVVRLNNCDGKADATQIAERGQTVQVEGGAELGVNIQVVQAAVTGKYSTASHTSKSQVLTAPPGTNMEFTLAWTVEQRVGVVTKEGQTANQARYRYFRPIDVQIKAQRDLGCGGGSKPTLPTIKPTDTPIPKPGPTLPPPPMPTIPSDTRPGSILDVGQSWWQGQMELELVQASLRAGDSSLSPSGWYQKDEYFPEGINKGGVDIRFRLTSHKAQAVVVRYTLKSVSATDNSGNKLVVFCWSQAGFPTYYYGAVECRTYDEMLSPGQTIDLLGVKYANKPWMTVVADVANPSVKEIVVRVTDIAGINDARWRITIAH